MGPGNGVEKCYGYEADSSNFNFRHFFLLASLDLTVRSVARFISF